jgi:hypothetical protein
MRITFDRAEDFDGIPRQRGCLGPLRPSVPGHARQVAGWRQRTVEASPRPIDESGFALRGQTVTWAYRGEPGRRFSSNFLGSAERLPGGTTLITESAAGRAFEVTPDGERVWEYVNPHRAGDDGELIATLLEVVRIERDYFEGEFAAALAAGGDAGPGRADPGRTDPVQAHTGGAPGE